MKSIESKIQTNCVNWFRFQYPQYRLNLFSVPNGGYRHISTARAMKREGAVSGVADLLLLVPTYSHNGLLIEMKAEKGRLSKNQKQWLSHLARYDYLPVVCHSLEQFQKAVTEYCNDVPRYYNL